MEPEKKQFNGRTERTASALDEGLAWAISEKGAVSVYGVGRWPVTLYAGTWRRLFAGCEGTTGPGAELLEFISDHESLLAEPPSNNRGAKPKTETFSIDPKDVMAIEAIAAGENVDKKHGIMLMSISATAQISGGKVTFEQLAYAKAAIKNNEVAKPNPANANRTE